MTPLGATVPPVLLGGLEFSRDDFAQRIRHVPRSVVVLRDADSEARSVRRAEWVREADAERAPWFRAEVACTPSGAAVSVVAHHLAWDGWSAQVFRRQLVQALSCRRIEATGYRDWVAHEPELIAPRRDLDLDLDSWLPIIQGELATADDAGSPTALHPAHETRRVLAPAELDRLHAAAPLLLPTVAQCLRAALATFGAPHQLSSIFNGRTMPSFRDTIGCFVNPLVLPLSGVPPDTGPSALLDASQQVQHGVVPFDQIMSSADAHRRARGLLGQVVLVDRVGVSDQMDLSGLIAHGDAVTVLDHPLLVRPVVTENRAVLSVTGREGEWCPADVYALSGNLYNRLTAL